MKSEHAQEIYDIISNLDNLANENCIGDRDKIDEAVERARELLGLERPDVPEPGTIVEYHLGATEKYRAGWFHHTDPCGQVFIETVKSRNEAKIAIEGWRYPGEKEWRE